MLPHKFILPVRWNETDAALRLKLAELDTLHWGRRGRKVEGGETEMREDGRGEGEERGFEGRGREGGEEV